jgi:hypothetical protein
LLSSPNFTSSLIIPASKPAQGVPYRNAQYSSYYAQKGHSVEITLT